MTSFLLGLALGLVIACWVRIRAERERVNLVKSINAGNAIPDEYGNIGWVIK